MTDELLAGVGSSAWALPLLFLLVFADGFLVVVPGEAAVTALAALGVATGRPPLTAVIAVAAIAAFAGDALCYAIGRALGLERWRWMRGRRARTAFSWARRRLDRSTAAIVFTARFIPFARLAVNLTAGASRVPAPRYLAIAAVAATGWAAYQSFVGAIVAWLIPGSTLAAVLVSVGIALALGLALDALLARRVGTGVGAPRHDGDMHPAAAASVPTGYDPRFLGTPLPLPEPVADRSTAALPYLHFSVTVDTARQLAVVTGVNIDGGSLRDLERTGQWHLDPRIDPSEQTGPAVYTRNDLDRGHLVRRRDPGWGTEAVARAATEATFAYTNAAPQVGVFNQSEDLWLGLEDHVLRYAGANGLRVSVFTAPVLADDDPPYRGILVPRRFWKVAAWVDAAGALAAAGFVLDQTALLDEVLDDARGVAPLGGFRTFQAPIADIGSLAGIDFGALVTADVLTDQETAFGRGWIEVAEPADIRLGRDGVRADLPG